MSVSGPTTGLGFRVRTGLASGGSTCCASDALVDCGHWKRAMSAKLVPMPIYQTRSTDQLTDKSGTRGLTCADISLGVQVLDPWTGLPSLGISIRLALLVVVVEHSTRSNHIGCRLIQ